MPDAVPAIPVARIGVVRGGRSEMIEDHWGPVVSRIVLDPAMLDPDATLGLDGFSHIEVISISIRPPTHAGLRRTRAATPRGLRSVFWPGTGRCGRTTSAFPVALLAVDGLQLTVRGLDAIDGTPVLDIKPYATEYNPRGPIREPAWMRELMRGYF